MKKENSFEKNTKKTGTRFNSHNKSVLYIKDGGGGFVELFHVICDAMDHIYINGEHVDGARIAENFRDNLSDTQSPTRLKPLDLWCRPVDVVEFIAN